MAPDSPTLGFAGGGAKLPARAAPGLRWTSFGVAHGARDPVDDRHRDLALIERARPASGAPPRMTTSAPSSSTTALQSAFSRAAWSSCTRPMSRSGWSSERTLARRPMRPFRSTLSRYHVAIRREIPTMENRLPSRQAVASAASVSPTTGTSSASRSPAAPGLPNAATITASWPCQCSAASSAAAYAPISASKRVSM